MEKVQLGRRVLYPVACVCQVQTVFLPLLEITPKENDSKMDLSREP